MATGLAAQDLSTGPREDYVPIPTEETLDLDNTNTALLIQDVQPWTMNANVLALQEFLIPYTVINSASLASHDLSGYQFIMYASDQPTSYYQNVSSSIAKIEAFVNDGGFLIAHLCDGGWSGGYWTGLNMLPGGGARTQLAYQNLTIVNTTHPAIAGTGGAFDIYAYNPNYFDGWGYSTHGYFYGLPSGAVTVNVIAGSTNPTYVSYNYGDGEVWASMQTVEWGYACQTWVGCRPELLRNELRYALAFQPPTGDLYGYVTESGVGIPNIPVDVVDDMANLYATVYTDANGYYELNDIPNGSYVVALATPLGYYCTNETVALEVEGGTYEVNFELIAYEIVPQQRPRGYWAHQLYRAIEGRPQDYTLADFRNFGSLIDAHFNNNVVNPVEFYTVPQPATGEDSMAVMRELLHMGDRDESHPFPMRISKAQLIALMLNVVSGGVHQMSTATADGRTFSQVITYCDLLIDDLVIPAPDLVPGYSSDNTEWYPYVLAGYMLHMANVGNEIPAGLVPGDVDNIYYRLHGDGQTPSEFRLHQNYPNPFNPYTEIWFNLAQAGHARLEVYNMLGQKVTTLVDGNLEAGYHRVTWDGAMFASGIYLYRLQASDFVESKKMLLVK